MKYCKNCRILYSSQAAACPKCGVAEPSVQPEPIAQRESSAQSEPCGQPEAEPASPADVRRDWIWIVVGVPVLIGVVYLLILLLKSLG